VRDAVAAISDTYTSPDVRLALAALPAVLEEVRTSLTTLSALVVEVDSSVSPMRASVMATSAEAAETLQEMQTTLAHMQVIVQPGSPLIHNMERALYDLSLASRAMQSLAETMERNPGAFLRGKEARANNP
jgi:paraquat-inducible protein B